mgnify:CR=1 FL=1|tara:strand:- start:889 stop:1074 length:186 start_codon:yes stop_codon:yes gene_type:complete
MKIVVKELEKKRFSATLFINDEQYASSVEPRPGCAVRTVMNQVQLEFGAPTEEMTITIDGW